MSAAASDRIALPEIAVAEAETVLCVLQARKQLAQARLAASLAQEAHLNPVETGAAAVSSHVSSPSSASLTTHSNPISPLHTGFLLSPPRHTLNHHSATVVSPPERSRAQISRLTPPPSIYTSADSAGGSDAPPPRPKKPRRHHALLVSAKGTRVQVPSSQRHHWLYQGHCAGDRSRPVNHCLKLPPAYFPVLDNTASLDHPPMSFRPVSEDWQSHQPEVVHHVNSVLRTHSHKVSCALSSTALQGTKGRKRTTPSADMDLSSTDSESSSSSILSSSKGRGRGRGTVVKVDTSDWEEDDKG